MPTINRNDAIAKIQHAGYAANAQAAMDTYMRSRISAEALFTEYGRGGWAKAEGKPCPCAGCEGGMEALKTTAPAEAREAFEVRHAFENTEADLGVTAPLVEELRQEMHESATDNAELETLRAEIGADGELHPDGYRQV